VTTAWSAVAADGTDGALLRRVVARLLGRRGAPRTVVGDAVTLAERVRSRGELVDLLAPEPHGAAREAADAVARRWRELAVRAAVVGDPAFPERLARGWPTTGGPLLLAWRGPPDAVAAGPPGGPAVAIVGARRATSYGTGIASWLGSAAAEAGVLVVSGGAVGVDAAAHRGSLDAGGTTVVVLGCGHDVGYPRAHASPDGLFDRILRAGGWIVTELPPAARPVPSNVLARNRLVAGMCDALVVVEGGDRSGSLRTAEVAAERGVPVLAVPGDVRAAGSAAPHRLLREGAAPCTGPEDLLAVLGRITAFPGGEGAVDATVLPDPVLRELAAAWPRAMAVTELADRSGTPAGVLLAALTRGRIAGEVAEDAEGVRLRRAPRSRFGRGSRRPRSSAG
jgi:DNA processing protein